MILSNIKIYEDIEDEKVLKIACKKNKVDVDNVNSWHVIKKSIDARDKKDVHYNYSIKINEEEKDVDEFKREKDIKDRPVIIGAGPSGLFAALSFVQNNVKPIIIEQGKTVEERKKDVDAFLESGKLNTLSNVQFGEGGAGTFSDGKLTTGINDSLCRKVLKEFVNFGAPEQILYVNKPHIGTDNLMKIIHNMRVDIEKLGGEFKFKAKVCDFEIKENRVVAVVTDKGERIETSNVILAIGHSARDTFEKIYNLGFNMEKKNFSIGVRVEHKQDMINKSQYGDKTKLKLPPAEYKLAYHGQDRSCYTFCMCPGGVVMASSSEEDTVVTNGMSKFKRDGENANSALLVNITPEDFKGKSPLEGIYFQKELEKKAFILGGKNYFAPVQRIKDFMDNVKTIKLGDVKPSYKPGVTLSNLNEILPEFVSTTLKEGIVYFDTKIKGFANDDALLTGIETRSSSPVKILRDENLQSNIRGIYPCGEGAGYAGGIMSAAVDGIKCARKIMG